MSTKNGLGYFFGDFVTNSSGHPAGEIEGMCHDPEIRICDNLKTCPTNPLHVRNVPAEEDDVHVVVAQQVSTRS
jgi:hypothetical protein